jgi:NAD(P)-dependent dehydrogenase (short-subunit alcohol dehydrogenase family)/acyl carrier protein
VVLPTAVDEFALHPALLDAALHPMVLGTDLDRVRLPFAWSGISLHSRGASSLRVRLTPAGEDTVAVHATDESGRPVITIDSLTLREMPDGLLKAGRGTLLRQEWVAAKADAVDAGPILVLGPENGLADEWLAEVRFAPDLTSATGDTDVVVALVSGTDVSQVLREWLATAQTWVAAPRFAHARLVVVTRAGDLAGAAVSGLIRSAQSEHPGRFTLLAMQDKEVPLDAVLSAEPELLVRDGELLAPRLTKVPSGVPGKLAGTVLITGGTGTLGRELAKHLALAHGVRRLVLASRAGGGEDLVDELAELGAEAEVVACDVSDRAQVKNLLAGIADLTAVVHAAGVVDDGVLESLTEQQLERVLRPKVDGATHLHELTEHLGLTAFVLFSSAAGVLGAPGQANYAAANAYLDALATHRRSRGLPATALAWGFWAQRTGLTGHLGDADLHRMSRLGLSPLSTEDGLALFDAALGLEEAVLVPVGLDRARLATGDVPSALRGLMPAKVSTSDRIERHLAEVPENDRPEIALRLVRTEAATVLGHADPSQVRAARPFRELGFDSLTAVELRNRLTVATGLRLPATVVFDHPTPAELADRLVADLRGDDTPPVLAELDRLEASLTAGDLPAELRDLVLRRLGVLVAGPAATGAEPGLDDASDDDLFDIIQNEFGRGLSHGD